MKYQKKPHTRQNYVVILLLLSIASYSSMPWAKELTIGYSGYSSTQQFWQGISDAAAEQAEEMGHTFVDLTATQPDADAQKDAIDRALNMGVDGIIVGPVTSEGFDAVLGRAASKQIPVITVDAKIEHSWVSSLVQTDNLSAAKKAGDYLVRKLKGRKKVLILGGTKGHETGMARRDGVKKAVEAAGHQAIFVVCDWDEVKAYLTTMEYTKKHKDIAAIFAASDPMALAAVAAVRERKILHRTHVVGFDGNEDNLYSIISGEQAADIKQDNAKIGRESVINLVKIIQGEKVPKFIPIDGILITKNNAKNYIQ